MSCRAGGTSATGFGLANVVVVVVVMEGDMKASHWNVLIQSLVLVRLGQELGTDSPLARAIAEVVRVIFTLGR
jgi:type III secretory pathway component EscT